MTGSQIAEEAVIGSCTFRPFVHDETNVGAFSRKPISNTAIGVAVDNYFIDKLFENNSFIKNHLNLFQKKSSSN